MTTSAPIGSGKWPTSVWIFLYLSLTASFFAIWHWDSQTKAKTLDENIFLFIYASIMAIYWGLVFRHMTWINAHWPKGFNSYWQRIALGFVVVLAIGVVVMLLPLPAFYKNALGQHSFLWVIPPALGSRRLYEFWGWGQKPSLTTEDRAGGDITLCVRSRKALFLFLVSILFVIAGLAMLHKNPVIAWSGILFFGLCALVGVAMLIPGSCSLALGQDGFVMTNLWRRSSFRWTEVGEFAVVTLPVGPRVGWNFVKGCYAGKARPWVKEMVGRDAYLTDDYGMSPDELCALMIKRKEAADRLDLQNS